MARLRFNAVEATLAAPLDDDDTTITFASKLTALDGDLPTIAAPDYLVMRIDDEIIYVTAYTAEATTATISRGEEGTTAASHDNGSAVRHVPTADDFQFVSAGAVLATTSPQTISGSVTMVWHSVTVDDGGLVDLVNHPERITVPAGKGGWWQVSAYVWWGPKSGLGRRLEVRQYDADDILKETVGGASVIAASDHNDPRLMASGATLAAEGDYFVVWVDENASGTATIDKGRFSAVYVGASAL